MSPLELVQGSVVERVVRKASHDHVDAFGHAGVPVILFQVIVRLPGDKGLVRFDSASRTAWRKVVKKAQLKLTTNVAKTAAAELRARIDMAVEAERKSPDSALVESRIIGRFMAARKRRAEKEAARIRVGQLELIAKLMKETRLTRQEVLDLWSASVLADVMGS